MSSTLANLHAEVASQLSSSRFRGQAKRTKFRLGGLSSTLVTLGIVRIK